MIFLIYTNNVIILPEYQFVYPDSSVDGSELIVPAPFRDGVNRDNQFAG